MVLLDLLDVTPFEGESVLAVLRTLYVPTCVLGSGVGAGDCAPLDTNFAAFYAALSARQTPRLLGVLRNAEHTQFCRRARVAPRRLLVRRR
jgi:hypothetical protein